MNDFVNYLNSMNNANANNINALAESQVNNNYYDEIQIDRKIGQYIIKKIKSGEKSTFILTGHAGDGKTSILVQILKSLNLLSKTEKLKEKDIKLSPYGEILYIKDMSELTKQKQTKYLVEALEAPKRGQASILISNTGPLIEAFEEIFENKYEIEMKLLKQLDQNKEEKIEIEGYTFYLINIARVDNVIFSKKILEKLININFWDKCNCNLKDNCPIYRNVTFIKNNYNKVSEIIEYIYRYFYEHDKRMTIRQILAHLTFAITGNLSCEDVKKLNNNKFTIIKYNFSNLFFGYVGEEKNQDAEQIKIIRELDRLNLDGLPMYDDYEIFIKNDFSHFDYTIQSLLYEYWEKKYLKYYSVNNEIENKLEYKLSLIRKMIKRIYIFYSFKRTSEEIIKILFGDVFLIYSKMVIEELGNSDKKKIKAILVDGLNRLNLGMTNLEKSLEKVYITLRRNGYNYQNVFVLLGDIDVEKLNIKQIPVNINFEDYLCKYKIYLSYENKLIYELNLPLLMYFEKIIKGKIDTKINPSLTHGISNLESKLLDICRYDNDKIIRLIINNFNNIDKLKIEIETNNKIFASIY